MQARPHIKGNHKCILLSTCLSVDCIAVILLYSAVHGLGVFLDRGGCYASFKNWIISSKVVSLPSIHSHNAILQYWFITLTWSTLFAEPEWGVLPGTPPLPWWMGPSLHLPQTLPTHCLCCQACCGHWCWPSLTEGGGYGYLLSVLQRCHSFQISIHPYWNETPVTGHIVKDRHSGLSPSPRFNSIFTVQLFIWNETAPWYLDTYSWSLKKCPQPQPCQFLPLCTCRLLTYVIRIPPVVSCELI